VARFDRDLPWERAGGGWNSRRLYFQIVLGSSEVEPAFHLLLQRFSDTRPEQPSVRGETPLAIVVVDRNGRPIADECAVVSSFGWGLPRALYDDPSALRDWPQHEERLNQTLHNRLVVPGSDGTIGPLSRNALADASNWLLGELRLPPGLVHSPTFAIRTVASNDLSLRSHSY
jgi:hypothetical protein